MRGNKWKTRIAKENNAFMKELHATPSKVEATVRMFADYAEEAYLTYEVKVGSSKIFVTEEGNVIKWNWEGSDIVYKDLADLDVADCVVYSEDVKEGGNQYRISAVTEKKVLWTFDGRGAHGLSAELAILGDRVYCLEASSPLQYKWLVSIDLATGKDRQVHYEEHNPSIYLSLIRGENKCLFLVADNAGQQALYHVSSKGLRRLDKDGCVFFPVGYGPKRKEPCYLVRKSFDAPWEARGADLKDIFSRKSYANHGIDLVCLKEGIVVHREHGRHYIEGAESFWGEIQANPWALWNGMDLDLRVMIPGQTPIKGRYTNRLVFDKPEVYGDLRHGMARSLDGTSVGWLGTWSGKPKALIVVGYGAYGVVTHTGTARWRPYIEAGFAIGFAFIRGGGDDNDSWAKAGKLAGKERGVEDFEACVRALQKVTGVDSKHTCLFGRSAGGYLMGLSILRNPGGELARFVYTESPYVDVLQTSSNPSLPLTALEYLEFGDPAHNISDFEMLLRLSPIGGTAGAPGVFVLCRAGLNDRQVYPYESVKWMDVLRGKGEKKILYLTKGVGHSVHGDRVFLERAEDFLILCNKVLGVNR